MSKVHQYQSLLETSKTMSGIYGSTAIANGAGEKTAACHAFEAWEDTVIASFKDENGDAVTTGWEDKTISSGRTVYFGEKISKFTVTTGGLGQAFKYE